MPKSLRQRFEEFRDRIGMPINKVANHTEIDLNKMYNFSGGSSLKGDDAIALHEFLKKWEKDN